MGGLKWHYYRKFSNEYENIQSAFFNLFYCLFGHDCTLPITFPNYIVISADVPEHEQSTRCLKLNEFNEFAFVAYPLVCANEMTNETVRVLPKKVTSAVIEFSSYDVAKWIIGSFLAFSVGITRLRNNLPWYNLSEYQANKLWEFVANLDEKYLTELAKIIESVLTKNTSIAFGIMDFDPGYLIPIEQ